MTFSFSKMKQSLKAKRFDDVKILNQLRKGHMESTKDEEFQRFLGKLGKKIEHVYCF